jgi:hypothetical protein
MRIPSRRLSHPILTLGVALASACLFTSRPGAAFADGLRPFPSPPTTLLSMPRTMAGDPGTIVQVPINTTPGDGILGIDVSMTYDPAVLEAQDVTPSGIAAAAGFILIPNLTRPGVILMSAYATGDALDGSGEIARIQFRVRGSPGDVSALTFTNASLNEGEITATVHDGLFTTVAATTMLSMPGDAQGGHGMTVTVPISAAPADGIFGIDMVVHYDPGVLLAQNVTVSGIASAAGFAVAANANTPGTVIISTYATSNPLHGSGEILRIEFLVPGDTGTRSALTFSSASINEGGIAVTFGPGSFIVNRARRGERQRAGHPERRRCHDRLERLPGSLQRLPRHAFLRRAVRLQPGLFRARPSGLGSERDRPARAAAGHGLLLSGDARRSVPGVDPGPGLHGDPDPQPPGLPCRGPMS